MQPGGIEIRLLELIHRLAPEEFSIDVCALSGLPGPLDEDVRAAGGEVFHLKLKSAGFPVRFLRLLNKRDYDVVHGHVLHSSGLALALAAQAGVPVRVAHFHSTNDGRATTVRRRVQSGLLRWLVRRYATDIIGVAEGVMCQMWGDAWSSDPRCRVVYDALDDARFCRSIDVKDLRRKVGVPPDARLFIHVGRAAKAKNYPRLLAIFAAIRRRDPESRLLLVGAGTDDRSGEIARTGRLLGTPDGVIGLGARRDVADLLRISDVLLLPSLWEGLPGVVLEACAAGTPVLASDLPGVQEIAARLQLVRTLPLTAPDDEWAMAALALPAMAAGWRLREKALESIRASVFHVDRAVEAHREIWTRARHAAVGESADAAWNRN